MRTLAIPFLSFSFLLSVPLAAQDSSELQRRAAEQERQIRSLEVENELLRDEIDRLRARIHAYEKNGAGSTPPDLPETTPATPPEDSGERIHVVRAGDSLSKIAGLYDTTTDKLARLNDIKNPSLIREGQKLKVPQAAQAEAPATDRDVPDTVSETVSGTHRVKAGETFYSIARIYGLSVEALTAANPDVNPRALRIGQQLRLAARKVGESNEPGDSGSGDSSDPSSEPDSAPPPPDADGPSVRLVPIDETMTFGEFARRHRMDPAKLNALNGLHLEPKRVLATGSRLYVSAQPLQ